MTLSPARVPDAGTSGVRRLTATLYGYAFLDDFVLLYPVYALLFSDTGLSIWQISSLFALWSITGILLEVPSGAWADAVSRRLLLWLGPLLTAAGFALWVIVPSYWAFALGFVLWGVRGALGSGALEALVYDELDRLGAADRYARVIGRAQAVGMVAVMAAMGLAGPVLDLGGYPAVGAASVLVCVLTSVMATRFPEHRPAEAGQGDRVSTLTTLRTGLAEVRRDRSVRGALLLVPAVGAVWGALDEYTPLLVRDTGVAEQTVPYLLLVIWVGPTIGSLLTGAGERLGTAGLGVVLAGSAFALAVGASTRTPAGIGLVAVAFGGFQLVNVLADARLQDRIEGARRATLTSVASMGTELATVGVFAAYAVIGASHAHGVAFAVFAVPYLVTAIVLMRRDT
ncbi:MFS transporter [Streptomyces europaeiscabiei]|uniref:MFS transporter n=1 Tax=Streptomyces europaeiscabiei TaxID=146819 RepID=A0ABU4NQR1_9ACTN|nr:MFS transporter [Streptomyces europaeiscabiei]MDX3547012.1 MFS transporter [Streptomyces europaeiscabiei]MDX3556705.1 MFS transporter [Streptomyces europaeiscabiei]MDX3668863.1 MFS transporter [Streptomyces europaeiscabiei]MDX3704413.1 MFS transporter [Streptomyces europaeiscabiei]MDX3713474.1 MFS transporter [Streptomyces europaeiscabiei]